MRGNAFDRAVKAALCENLARRLMYVPDSVKRQTTEIRLRTGRPLMLTTLSEPAFLLDSGDITYRARSGVTLVEDADIQESFRKICGYSVHSYQNEIRSGFLTVGGNRIGFCGTAVAEEGRITAVRGISSLNVRIARQIDGAADPLISLIQREGLCGILIAGPPAAGKTTMLKDFVRRLCNGSIGHYTRVAVIDERGEIGGAENDLGYSSDIYNGYPKEKGMELAIRTMAPEVIVCDEIGNRGDLDAIRHAVHAGVILVATIHASGPQELLAKPDGRRLLRTGAFSHVAFLAQESEKCRVSALIRAEDVKKQEVLGHAEDTGIAACGGGFGDDRAVPVLQFFKEGHRD